MFGIPNIMMIFTTIYNLQLSIELFQNSICSSNYYSQLIPFFFLCYSVYYFLPKQQYFEPQTLPIISHIKIVYIPHTNYYNILTIISNSTPPMPLKD